ncbi:hypothetical protein I6B53_03085 [Schaalia sp. 19OD2882]|uniref:hypothetical protein n=1 Tax=Schaalia sp. 19OD2882 TaxID=2794089 RepID=UPI001C1F086B|nr:hypothetical protein [Schaalia sp. 19OD2882]QWW20098.1 hypothetical protein I6B53_03085 [Schaalia sp. 19OD2882]
MRPRAKRHPESGEASVEFVGYFVVLVIPLIYFILMLSQVQASVFAAESGASVAARSLAIHRDDTGLARAQVDLAFADHGLAGPVDMDVGCRICSGPEEDVSVTVRTQVTWPLVPGWTGLGVVPVEATSTVRVDKVVLQ